MPNFQWDFSDEGQLTWLRYWLASLCRASLLSNASLRQAVVACIDDPALAYYDNLAAPNPNQPMWFATKHANNNVLIVLSGTYLPVQWYGHLSGLGMVSNSWYPGKAHSFWVSAASSIGAAIATDLGSFTGPPKFFITGHSWGGAVAQLLAYYLALLYPGATFQVVTFGAPRVGNDAFAAGWNAYLACMQGVGDPVCYLPPAFSNTLALSLAITTFGASLLTYGMEYADVPGAARPVAIGSPITWANGLLPGRSNASLASLLTNTRQMRWHSLYYYAKYFWGESGRPVTTQPQTLPDGKTPTPSAFYGYNLGSLTTQNAQMSVAEALVVSPAFPVPPAAEP